METANPASFSYMNRALRSSPSSSSSSGAFSDCNSDRSGDFTPARRLPLPGTDVHYSDELARCLVADLSSPSLDDRLRAAMELRLLAKHNPENRLRIAAAGAVPPLVSLLSSTDPDLLEHVVTSVLNLSLLEENKNPIAAAGAIWPLVRVLKAPYATSATRENAACALQRLAQVEEHRSTIGRSGAIPLLVGLLESGGLRGKKDAAAALYTICSGSADNAGRAARAGVARPLLELMAEPEAGMVDKAAFVMATVVEGGREEAARSVVEEGGVPVLVELLETGSRRQRDVACEILLRICEVGSAAYCSMIAREGAIPPLVDLSQTGSSRVKKKAENLISILRQPRTGSSREGSVNM